MSDYCTELSQRRGGYISAPDGWLELVKECDELLAHLDPDYRIIQIKEKFGGLRYYFATELPNPTRLIMQIVASDFGRRSMLYCQECGEPGKTAEIRNWYYTLCNDHFKDEWTRT